MNGDITITDIKERYAYMQSILHLLENDRYKIFATINNLLGWRNVEKVEKIYADGNTDIYEVTILNRPNCIGGMTFSIKFKNGNPKPKLLNKIKVNDKYGNPTWIALNPSDDELIVTDDKYTQMRTSASAAETIKKGIARAKELREMIERKVCGLGISLQLMEKVLREDADMHVISTRIDTACDLIDFDIENLCLTLTRRYREHCDEPYWTISPNVEIWDEDETVRIACVNIDK